MTIQASLEEITGKISAMAGVVAYEWDVKRIATTPAVVVGLPERVEYRTAYSGRGKKIRITATLLVGDANARASAKTLTEFIETDGERSFFRAVDSQFTSYTTCDDVTVLSCEPDQFIVAGNTYLGAEFEIDVTATGA